MALCVLRKTRTINHDQFSFMPPHETTLDETLHNSTYHLTRRTDESGYRFGTDVYPPLGIQLVPLFEQHFEDAGKNGFQGQASEIAACITQALRHQVQHKHCRSGIALE